MNRLRPQIILTLLLGTSFAGAASLPKIPATGRAPQDFVPSGWTLRAHATGDLNQDGVADQALAIDPQSSPTHGGSPLDEMDRVLLLLFGHTDGTLSLAATQQGLLLCKQCGGLLGDPLSDLRIERGTVAITLYGGSRDRWGMTYRFRWQQDDWYLIGYTHLVADNLELTSRTIDINWSTGKVVTTQTKKERDTTQWSTKKLPPLRLRDCSMETVDRAAGIQE